MLRRRGEEARRCRGREDFKVVGGGGGGIDLGRRKVRRGEGRGEEDSRI
jgi:hypothetical protein